MNGRAVSRPLKSEHFGPHRRNNAFMPQAQLILLFYLHYVQRSIPHLLHVSRACF